MEILVVFLRSLVQGMVVSCGDKKPHNPECVVGQANCVVGDQALVILSVWWGRAKAPGRRRQMFARIVALHPWYKAWY